VPGPRIVLVRTKDSANVGAAARAMRNFGLDDLWLVAPRCRIDERARALASHAGDLLESAQLVDTLDEALVGITLVAGTSARPRRAPSYAVTGPREAAPRLLTNAAVLFGPEDHGLANEELTRSQLHVVVPTAELSSLNLAQAVLVVAYEVHLARIHDGSTSGLADVEPAPLAGHTGEAPASRDQLEAFYGQFGDTLLRIGFTDPPRLPSVMRMFRAVFDRAELSAHELAALRGLASQARWAADQPPEALPPAEAD